MIDPDTYFSLSIEEEVDSTKYRAYKEKYDREIGEFYARLDTTEKIVFVIDSLSEISFEKEEKHIRSRLEPSDSSYFSFFSKSKQARTFNIDSLDQPNITFRSYSEYEYRYYPEYNNLQEYQFEFVGDEYWIGIISFSRLLLNNDNDLGIFEFSYVGGSLCAYGGYYLIKKIDGMWLIHKQVITWVS